MLRFSSTRRHACWGEVRQKVTETSRRKAEPGAGYDEYVEYALLDTANNDLSGRR
jgi:hypothetical protein